jgi:hypothetical protein
MELSSQNLYEVEKIINCKYFKNKKYYLIKWLCYPINQSTWEPKTNLKHLKYLIDEFEDQYPYTIDKSMYNIFCNEVNNKKKIKNKGKKDKNLNSNLKFLSKKRIIEPFNDSELNNQYLNELKIHLHIKVDKKSPVYIKNHEDDFYIDLTENTKDNEGNNNINIYEKDKYENNFEENKQKNFGLVKPIVL